jgi:putative glycosyltransferase
MAMKLSIVTTVYKSEHFLKGFVTQSLEAVEKAEIDDFELVFVIDGITDQSIALLLNEKENTPQIKIVELTRNFGHHFAITAGLEQASGEWVFLIDCDLEVSPLVLVDFLNKQKEADADVVYGIQKVRKGSALERVLGGFFWKIFNLLSETPLPPNLMTERLMNRAYVQSLLSLGDKNLFLGGMMHWVGYNQIPLEIEKTPRSGKSSYSLLKRLSLLENAITSFSEYPLKLILLV